jgi:hypothetical protein
VDFFLGFSSGGGTIPKVTLEFSGHLLTMLRLLERLFSLEQENILPQMSSYASIER